MHSSCNKIGTRWNTCVENISYGMYDTNIIAYIYIRVTWNDWELAQVYWFVFDDDFIYRRLINGTRFTQKI